MLPLKLIPMIHVLELDEIKMYFKTVTCTFTKRRPRPTQGCRADDGDDDNTFTEICLDLRLCHNHSGW
jgi:hypothetical protein